jgi:stage II sporulation protein R
MKNKIIASYFILLSLTAIISLYIPKTEAKEELIIPNEAIRLRILANSDSDEDQNLKRKVRDAVNAQITLWVQDLTSLEKARTTIQSNLPEIQRIAERVVKEQNETQTVNVEFGKVDFPTKLYGQFLYPAGEYEAILITMGEGKGANWWCVLFPPLCFLDFSNGVAVRDEGFEDKKAEKENKKEVTQKSKKAAVEVVTELDEKENEKGNEKEKDDPSSKAPVYTDEDEQDVEVKFFLKELWSKIFS